MSIDIGKDPSGRPVLQKRETTPDGRSKLGHEADILSLAEHPGVVELLDFTDNGEATLVLAHLTARTPESLGPMPLAEVAGLLAEIAHTLSDLHDLGIVHGRVTADHVLVLADGRAVLCGWSAATATALPQGHPDAPRRHLLPADDVAALGELLARLAGPTELSPIPDRRRRWKADHDCRAALLTLADLASHDDPACRPSATAFAADVLALVHDARLPRRAAVGGKAPAPLPPRPGGLQSPSPETAELRWPSAEEPDPFESLIDAHGFEQPDPNEDGSGAIPSGHRFDGTPTLRRKALGALAEARPAPDRRWTMGRKLAVVGLVLLAGVGGTVSVSRSSSSGRSAPAALSTTTTAAAPVAAPRSTAPTASPTCGIPGAPDLDGDRCGDQVSVHDGVVTTPQHRYVVGGPGDDVVVADWDCDGRATPALLRAATGEVFLFPGWAEPGRTVTVPATDIARPGSHLAAGAPDDRGCSALTLHEPGAPDRAVTNGGRR